MELIINRSVILAIKSPNNYLLVFRMLLREIFIKFQKNTKYLYIRFPWIIRINGHLGTKDESRTKNTC